ncbi:MAG: PilW family protein [Methylotenera sp.]|nr:PilW family protein [Methylotenera sp.]
MMNNKNNALRPAVQQAGFSLVEILVGLVIGLLATLVIMQVFSAFEGQKRSTSGSSDAQTNGTIALHNIQRDVQMAGFGLPIPMADRDNASLNCNPSPSYDDGDPATPNLELFPLSIQNGAANASDSVTVRYSTTALGAVPVKITNPANATSFGLTVDNNIGCKDGDIALISQGTSCVMTAIADANGSPDTLINITLKNTTPLGGPIAIGAKLTCMGNWQAHQYTVVNNELQLDGSPIVAEIVNMQAQYGVSATADNNQVTQWVDATTGGIWENPTVANRNRIKAVRIVVIARNGLLEKDDVTNVCTTAKGVVNNGPCAWDDADFDAAPLIDLSADADWQKYRYRAFETIIPLRNMIWSKDVL